MGRRKLLLYFKRWWVTKIDCICDAGWKSLLYIFPFSCFLFFIFSFSLFFSPSLYLLFFQFALVSTVAIAIFNKIIIKKKKKAGRNKGRCCYLKSTKNYISTDFQQAAKCLGLLWASTAFLKGNKQLMFSSNMTIFHWSVSHAKIDALLRQFSCSMWQQTRQRIWYTQNHP